jgi:hypothetical protein
MKNGLIYIILGGVIVWNVLLSLPKDEKTDSINYELLQKIHHENEQRFQKYELQINRNLTRMYENDTFVDNADARQLDSLESIYFR